MPKNLFLGGKIVFILSYIKILYLNKPLIFKVIFDLLTSPEVSKSHSTIFILLWHVWFPGH